MPDQFEQYYKYLKANGADVAPDFNSFKNTLSDYNNASKYYSYLKENQFDVPATYDSFADTFGLKKKDGGIVSSLTELPLQGFNQKQIDLLKKGVEKPIQSVSQKKSSGLVVPTNLPKQEALAYENELKLSDVAANTLTDIYKKKGLKFDPSRPAAKKQIQEYVDKSINGDLTKVTGKDGKEYLVRSQGFLESAGDSFVRSLKDPIESTEINFTDSPEELANLLDEKIRREPNVPEAAPSAVSGYLGGLAGGLPKLSAIAAIPYVGQTAMVGEMYYNALANQRRELYQRGLEEGMDRVSAAKKAMEIAPVSAIPDALVAAVMAKGVGGKAASGVIPNAAKESFIKAAGSALKSIGVVSATGGFAGYERSKIQQRAGYKVTDAEAIENGFREAGDYAIMDAAFKVAHIGPKYLSSAAKNVLSTVPKEVLNVVAEKYPDGQRTLDEIPKFVETKAKVQDFVPEEKIASVAGLTEKTDNIKSEIKDLEEKKKAVTPAIAKEIDLEISEKNKEVDFYDNQIKKVIKSKDQTGISEEVDDATGLKAGEQIVPKEFKITEEVTPTEFKVTEEVIEKDDNGDFVPKKFTLNRAGENQAPNIPIESIKEESFGGEIPTDVKEVKLLEIRGRNAEGETVGSVSIKMNDGTSNVYEVKFNDEKLSTLEVKPTEVKVSEEVKPAEIKQPAKELAEGEGVTFKTPEGSKITGEKVEIPGYEDMDLVLVRDGFENKIYELSSGLEMGGTQEAFSKEDAINSLRKQLQERNITSGKVHNVIFKGEKVKQINPSKKFETYAEERKSREAADYEKMPLKYSPEEIKKLEELKKKSIEFGIDKKTKEIEDAIASRSREGKFKAPVTYFESLLDKEIERKIKKEYEARKEPYPKEFIKEIPTPTLETIKKTVNQTSKRDKYEKIPDDIKKIMLEGYQKNVDILNKYGYYPYEQSNVFFDNLLRFMGNLGARENREARLIEARKKLISSLEDVRKVHEKEFGKAKEEVKPKEEKTFAQKDLDRAEAKRIHGMVAEMEPPIDAEQVALRYLAEGGKVSQDAINEVSGTTKRASLNTGRRELKTEEAKARDYAGGTESLDDLAHRLWEASGQEISERDIKDAIMSEIGNNNTRLDASKAYLERYNIEYQQEKYYESFIEEREEQHAKVQDELERDLRKPLEEEIEGMSSEEHINNLIKQYEAETKRENKQLRPEGEGKAVEEISSRDTGKKAPEKAELAKEYKEAVNKASKKAKENAKKDFVDRNFENLVEKLKIQIKCPT